MNADQKAVIDAMSLANQRFDELEEILVGKNKEIDRLEALNIELVSELKNIANARRSKKWPDFNAVAFLGWAQSRARHAIEHAKAEARK